MNSRERLLTVFSHQIPDRVPISTYELSGFNSKSFENIDPSYKNLMDAVRHYTDCISMWGPGSSETFLASSAPVEMDTKETSTDQWTEKRFILHTPKGDLTRTIRMQEDVHTVWKVERWCKSIADVEKALSVPYEPVSYDFSDLPRIQGEVNDNGIIMGSIPDPLCIAAELMEFGDFTVWAFTETDHFINTLNIIHERLMNNFQNMLAQQTVELYRIYGPEYATPPYFPPEYFNRFVTPYVKDITALIHEHDSLVRIHSHGKVGNVLDCILETGADVLEPCEAPPDGDIELHQVKEKIGRHMILMGNLQLKLLENESTSAVRETVKECMDSAKEGGRYIIMPTSAPINSPLSKKTEENYIAFFEAAHEFGRY